jgi:hypothetical protein
VTTPHKSLLHTDQCSQSRCSVTASKVVESSASGLMSLQAADHLTPLSVDYDKLGLGEGEGASFVRRFPGFAHLLCHTVIQPFAQRSNYDVYLVLDTRCAHRVGWRGVVVALQTCIREVLV